MNQIEEAYISYQKSIGDRKNLYQAMVKYFHIERALYPGSHIDIVPSFFIPDVTYVDSYKGAKSFFKDIELVKSFILKHKTYKKQSHINFFGQDYHQDLKIDDVDLVISKHAGFVSKAAKKYLKTGGILLANDSHGDATLAYLDNDFEFIGVIDNKYQFNQDHLEKYFKFKRQREIPLDQVLQKMRGPKYSVQAENYLFRKK